jgi:hypothetical protein
MFGRGGEEMEYLRERGIKVHIVPGITAAAGIGAELGIPLTCRGYANSATFLTVRLTLSYLLPHLPIPVSTGERLPSINPDLVRSGNSTLNLPPPASLRSRSSGVTHDEDACRGTYGRTGRIRWRRYPLARMSVRR